MSDDATIALISTVIADVLVLGGWVVTAVLIAVFTNRVMNRQLAALPEGKAEEPQGAMWVVLVAIALFFWPAGVALGILFLGKPETARAGRACVAMLLVNFSFAVVVAIGIVTAVALAFPQLLVP